MSTETPTFGRFENTADDVAAVEAPVVTGGGVSAFDLLKKEAEKELSRTRRFDVEAREGFQIEVNTNIPYSDFKRYQAASLKGTKDASKANALLLGTLMLADHTVGILYRNTYLEDEAGDRVRFTTEGFMDSFGVNTAASAVGKFLGDGHAIATGSKVLELAGYGAEVLEIEDPTDD